MTDYFDKPSAIAELSRAKAEHINTLADATEAGFDNVSIAVNSPILYTKTASATLTAAEVSGLNTINNDGAVAEIILTWPTLVDAQAGKFYVNDAQYLQIKAPAGKTIRMGPVTTAVAGYIRSDTVGDWVEVRAMSDGLVIMGISPGNNWVYDE